MKLEKITYDNFDSAISIAKSIFPYEIKKNGKLSFESAYIESIKENDPRFAYYIAKSGDLILGITGHYIEKYIEENDEIWLGWFGVNPTLRKNGIGKSILKETSKAVSNMGFDLMFIYSGQRKEEYEAHRLYKKNGFRKIGQGIKEGEPVFFFVGRVPIEY